MVDIDDKYGISIKIPKTRLLGIKEVLGFIPQRVSHTPHI
jgi:hypothetical protein